MHSACKHLSLLLELGRKLGLLSCRFLGRLILHVHEMHQLHGLLSGLVSMTNVL